MHLTRAARRAWRLSAAIVAITIALSSSARAQTIDDGVMMAQGRALHRRRLHARRLGRVLGGRAQTRQRQHRHADDPVAHVLRRLRPHQPAEHPRQRALRLDRSQPGRAARHERRAGPDDRGEVQRRRAAEDRRSARSAPSRVISASIPLTDYTPDFQPLSIGSASTRVSLRGTPSLQGEDGVFVDASACLHLPRHVDAGSAVLLHRRPALHDQHECRCRRCRLGCMGGFRGLAADGCRHRLAAVDAQRRRHPPPGRAVRLEPHERPAGRRRRDVSAAEAGAARGRGLVRLHGAWAATSASRTPCRSG